jgi:hypothetical protein
VGETIILGKRKYWNIATRCPCREKKKKINRFILCRGKGRPMMIKEKCLA